MTAIDMAAVDSIFLIGLILISAFSTLAYLAWNSFPDVRRIIIGLSIVNAGPLLYPRDFGYIPDEPSRATTVALASVMALAWAVLLGIGLAATAFAVYEYRQKQARAATGDATVEFTS